VAGAAATVTVDADAAATDTVEPTRIDPAALSARIAGTMIVRFMVMIPPWHLPRSAAYYMPSAAREAHLNYPEIITDSGYYMT
jgi:hypothetical protein